MNNPRPTKRQRVDSESSNSSVGENKPSQTETNETLSPVQLLALPKQLIRPPNHPDHARGLCLSIHALRQCLRGNFSLTAELECRAWTALAEVGMVVIQSGFTRNTVENKWAEGIELEVEKATSQGLLIAQKHPTLSLYRPRLTLLAGHLASLQQNTKFARNLLKRFLGAMNNQTYPMHVVYQVHLAYIDLLITPSPPSTSSGTDAKTAPTASPQPSKDTQKDTLAALRAIQIFSSIGSTNDHESVVLLASVIKLRLLVSRGMWADVDQALNDCEAFLGISFPETSVKETPSSPSALPEKALQSVNTNVPSPSSKLPKASSAPQTQTKYKSFAAGFEASMAVHILIIGVVFHTFVGNERDTAPRLNHLHFLLDSGALNPQDSSSIAPAFSFQPGVVDVPLGEHQPLKLKTTHLNVLFPLAFLTSAIAKRDPVGRKPKRKIFAGEGVSAVERIQKKEREVPAWWTLADSLDTDIRMAKLKADLWCEVIGVSIQRSEFAEAEQTLSTLIAHTRTYSIFSNYASRITLHHAHLAHAKGESARALECYRVAQYTSGAATLVTLNENPTKGRKKGRGSTAKEQTAESGGTSPSTDTYVAVAAMAGELALRLGILKEKQVQIARANLALGGSAKMLHMSGENEMDVDDDDDPLSSWGSPLSPVASSCSSPTKQSHQVGEDMELLDEDRVEMASIRILAAQVASLCKNMGVGGTLCSVGKVIEAFLCGEGEALSARASLKQAMRLATDAQDNHLRALILALLSSYFVHTAPDHAIKMLEAAEVLGSGMGARPKADKKGNASPVKSPAPLKTDDARAPDAIGNGPLRIWVGEKFLEIYKRAASFSDDPAHVEAHKHRIAKQEAANLALRSGWESLLAKQR